MSATSWSLLRASCFRSCELLVLLCVGCRTPQSATDPKPVTGPADATRSTDANDDLLEDTTSRSAAAPRFEAPPGWAVDCAAATCAKNYVDFHDWELAKSWSDVPLDAPADLAEFEQRPCDHGHRDEVPKTCLYEGDFDEDGSLERFTWVMQSGTYQFDLLMQWGDGRASLVGLGPWGHVNPPRHRSACAVTMFDVAQVVDRAITVEEDAHALSVVRREVDEGILRNLWRIEGTLPAILWFDGTHWRGVRLSMDDEELPTAFPHIDHAWPKDPPPATAASCKRARNIRKKTYRDRNAELVLPTPARAVARDRCELSLDLDGDGTKDGVAWVVHRSRTGLRIDWGDGRVSVLGAGRAVPIDVLEGEPGCNIAPQAFDDVWNVRVARWSDGAWRVPGGGTQVPFDTDRVQGDALAMTNAGGHVDLLFFVDGEPRLSAVPFPWDKIRVFWPFDNNWHWIRPPAPQLRRYRRPKPVRREQVRIETPGDPPNSPGFFAGK